MKRTNAPFFARISSIALLSALTLSLAFPSYALAEITRFSVTSAGAESGDGADSADTSISGDGRYAFFHGFSIVPEAGDTFTIGIYGYDLNTDTIDGMTLAVAGANIFVNSPTSVSEDGRYVAVVYFGSGLVAGDTNNGYDVFVYDRNTDTIEIVSVDDLGDGGNDTSGGAAISDDGRYVAFFSDATDIVAGDSNATRDVFVYDRNTDTVERVSVSNLGAQNSEASDGVFISGDGRYVGFLTSGLLTAEATDGYNHAFLYDRNTDGVELVDVTTGGVEADGDVNTSLEFGFSMSDDGRYVAFVSGGTNLVAGDTNDARDLFVRDRTGNVNERLTDLTTNDQIKSVSISGDGLFVAYSVNNIVTGIEDLYLYDRTLDTATKISEGAENDGGPSYLTNAKLSDDGSVLVFVSDATNLVAGDTNGTRDAFVYTADAPSSGSSRHSSHKWRLQRNALLRTLKTPKYVSTSTPASIASDPEDASDSEGNSEFQAQIDSLLTQIAALKAKLSLQASNPGVASFVRDLTLGDTGSDVKALQVYLNTHGYILGTIGPGSPGQETERFGALTRSALAKLQAAKGISPAIGYFGPLTRAFVNGNP